VDKSGAAAATGGNVIMTIFSPIGWAIDSATGSDNKYDTPVNVTLSKNNPTRHRRVIADQGGDS
jgi:hypothetical protein